MCFFVLPVNSHYKTQVTFHRLCLACSLNLGPGETNKCFANFAAKNKNAYGNFRYYY